MVLISYLILQTILKVVKEHAVSLSKHKTGYRLLIAIFDSVDDTVLVKKVIVSTLANNVQDIAKDHWGNMVCTIYILHNLYNVSVNEFPCIRILSSTDLTLAGKAKRPNGVSSRLYKVPRRRRQKWELQERRRSKSDGTERSYFTCFDKRLTEKSRVLA